MGMSAISCVCQGGILMYQPTYVPTEIVGIKGIV